MKVSKRAFNFNKEILIGEIGALLGAPLFGILGAIIFGSPDSISSFTIVGSIFGGSASWLVTRIYDEKKFGEFSASKITKNLSLYTPVAFLITILFTYPIVFLVTHALSVKDHITLISSLTGEMVGFMVFLILINTYRYVLVKSFNKII
jgi:positive regulator of sigma E activity